MNERFKYLVFDGKVFSQSDPRQTHFISTTKVAQLYRVPYDQCLFIKSTQLYKLRGYDKDWLKSLLRLAPRSDGDYNIDKRKREQGKQ